MSWEDVTRALAAKDVDHVGLRERQRREHQAQIAEREHRAVVRRKEDEAHARRLREKRAAAEAAMRERAEAELAEVRAQVERECRVAGVPSHEIRAVADEVMRRRYVDLVAPAATEGEKVGRELRRYFAARPAPAWQPGEP